MATNQMGGVLHNFRRFLLDMRTGMSDRELLDAFIAQRDESHFEALMHRHGRMVWGVCRRLLNNNEDAEDAFQAVFLIFLRKADSIMSRDAVGSWLYSVAYQTALNARASAAKRRGGRPRRPSVGTETDAATSRSRNPTGPR